MTAPMVEPTMQPVIACRAYLTRRLADRGITEDYLPVGATPPPGTPTRYVLLNQIDSDPRGPVTDYLLRARVYDADAYDCGQYGMMLHSALLAAAQTKIVFPDVGELWVTGARHQAGPSDLDDPDVALFGQAMAVFWTVAPKPIREATP